MEDDCTVERGSGNVFADLGIPNPEEHQAKVDLSIAIKHRIRDLGLTQEDVGRRTGLNQADISKITRGLVRGFTFDRLFRLLGALDQTVRIRVESSPAGSHGERVIVEAPAVPA